ncbi:hypothetical protein LCGC14_1868690 [marine sediment metagenome]|uniref:Glycosyl transferase family 1 domain-containing protein n=1 Tax=marine sediment metagenome TaxID=412755 RepID=A0A0F9GTQ7_9ZZZZ
MIDEYTDSPVLLSYIPHGVNPEVFKPLPPDNPELLKMKNTIFKNSNPSFVLFYNSRNIRRKMVSDLILAFKTFCDTLPSAEADKCALLMHTQPIDENGTDLTAVVRAMCPYKVVFSPGKLPAEQMNLLYNIVDVTAGVASNEGFGISTLESIMAGTPIIVNVTGGLQDQCNFMKDDGTPLTEHDYTEDWLSNHDGRYTEHGVWVKPVWPATRSIMGSPPTPFISDDRAKWEDIAVAIREWYNTDPIERGRCGLKGREFALDPKIGMSSTEMCRRFVESVEVVFDTWKPRSRFTMYNTDISDREEKIVGLTLTK